MMHLVAAEFWWFRDVLLGKAIDFVGGVHLSMRLLISWKDINMFWMPYSLIGFCLSNFSVLEVYPELVFAKNIQGC
ncbi:hypothetical protein BVRB_2g030510 isoform A [Beta vulgaris subsp. vulgaris]|nr:hypothetical protein BVRB_2g030510 isoform A [Beta vulgaris subsp. vulgaris]